MAEFEIKAGARVNLLSPKDFDDGMARFGQAWMADLARGVRWRRFSIHATSAANVFATEGDGRGDRIGPSAGFLWSVTMLAISGSGITLGTDLWSVFINSQQPSDLVESGIVRGTKWNLGGFVLRPNDFLTFNGAATNAGTDVVIAGQAVEVPVQLAWQLL